MGSYEGTTTEGAPHTHTNTHKMANTHRCSHSWSSYCALFASNDACFSSPLAVALEDAEAEAEAEEEVRYGLAPAAKGPALSMHDVRSCCV